VAQALPQRNTSTALYPFARHLSPSFSHSRARGTLAHSSSTPVASTTIQSRSTRHATSFAEYGCAPRYLFLSSVCLCFSSLFLPYLYSTFSYHTMFSPSLFTSLFFSGSRIIPIELSFFKKDNTILLEKRRDFCSIWRLRESELANQDLFNISPW